MSTITQPIDLVNGLTARAMSHVVVATNDLESWNARNIERHRQNNWFIALLVFISVIVAIGAAVYAYKICVDRGGTSVSGLKLDYSKGDPFKVELGFHCT